MQNSNWGSLGDILNPIAEYAEAQKQKQDMDALLQYFGGQAGTGVLAPTAPQANPLQQMGNKLLGLLGLGGQPIGLGQPQFGGGPNVNQPTLATSLGGGGSATMPGLRTMEAKKQLLQFQLGQIPTFIQKAQSENLLSEAEKNRAEIPLMPTKVAIEKQRADLYQRQLDLNAQINADRNARQAAGLAAKPTTQERQEKTLTDNLIKITDTMGSLDPSSPLYKSLDAQRMSTEKRLRAARGEPEPTPEPTPVRDVPSPYKFSEAVRRHQAATGTPSTKSPYPQWPDAFKEGNAWYVRKNGKKIRIED